MLLPNPRIDPRPLLAAAWVVALPVAASAQAAGAYSAPAASATPPVLLAAASAPATIAAPAITATPATTTALATTAATVTAAAPAITATPAPAATAALAPAATAASAPAATAASATTSGSTLAAAPTAGSAPAPYASPAPGAAPDAAPAASAPWWQSAQTLLGLDEAEGNYWRLMAFPYTQHFHKDEAGIHRPVYLFGFERQRANGWLWGAVYFSNSFGQSSGYVYLGERVSGWSPWPQLYAQWTAGVVYGYTYPYEDKIPFNFKGFAPGVIVGMGWRFTREFSLQANLLGAAGLMLGFTWDFR